MAISVNWPTGVITIPQADLTLISVGLYELNVDNLRLALKDLEDGEEGMPWPDTHKHNTQALLSGVLYARQLEILAPYTVTFQDTGIPYTVRCVGGNHNLSDVKNINQVSLIVGNSAGLIVAEGGGNAPSVAQIWGRQVEGSYTAEQILRIVAAALAGKVSGAESENVKFRDLNDSKDRIDAEVDSSGNRIAVTIDVS